MSDKIKPHHLQRKAILYVRQSTPYQVQFNQESRRLQYAMRQQSESLGWHDIETIDDDLGTTAAGTVLHKGSSGWWPRSVSAKLVSWRLASYHDSPATIGSGSN